MKIKLKHVGAVSALSMLALGAQAASFSFTGLGSVSASGYSTTVDGITVTVTTPGGNNLTSPSAGLGSNAALVGTSGVNGGEQLQVSFSEAVTIGTLSLGSWAYADNATLTSAGGNMNLVASFTGNTGIFDLSSLGGISSFTLTGNNGVLTGFNLAGLGNVQGSEVPVPAAAWLFGSALVGLFGFKKRK